MFILIVDGAISVIIAMAWALKYRSAIYEKALHDLGMYMFRWIQCCQWTVIGIRREPLIWSGHCLVLDAIH
jgi:hypothetical protein